VINSLWNYISQYTFHILECVIVSILIILYLIWELVLKRKKAKTTNKEEISKNKNISSSTQEPTSADLTTIEDNNYYFSENILTYSGSDDLTKIEEEFKENIAFNSVIDALGLFPIVGGIMKVAAKGYCSFTDYNLLRKLYRFLKEIENYDTAAIKKFIDEIKSFAEDDSAHILLDMVDKIDNINKSKILANLVEAKLNKLIDIEDFFRLSNVLQRIPYSDFVHLKEFKDPNFVPGGVTYAFSSVGVISLSIIDEEKPESNFLLTALGKKFLKYGLKENIDDTDDFGSIGVIREETTGEDIEKMFEKKRYEEENRGMFDYDFDRGK